MSTTSLPSRPDSRRAAVVSLVLATGVACLVIVLNGPSGAGGSPVWVNGVDRSFASGQASVDRLDPALRAAIQQAALDARAEGVEMRLNSGWRSREHQAELYAEGVRTYGSAREASRWVATPDTSKHVVGLAVDVGPPEAAQWLHRTGAALGLCRTYANEPWHFELVGSSSGECPPLYPDASARR